MDDREKALVFAAENVVARWAIVRVSSGALGGCGLPEALAELDKVLDQYPDDLDAPTPEAPHG